MQRIAQLISEIRDINPEPNHKNAIYLFRILEGNSKLFLAHMDAETFLPLLKRFSALADSSAKEFQTDYVREDYRRANELLLFYLNRI